MYRIDNTSAAATKPSYGAAGTEAFFQDTDVAGGTVVPASWANMIQEELRAVVVGGGLTPSKTDDAQVLAAINALISAAITAATTSLKPQQYAVGDLFITTRSGNPAAMSDIAYGTWVRAAEGQTLVGFKSSDSDFSTVGNTGGEKTHTLTIAEMPEHTHGVQIFGEGGGENWVTYNDGYGSGRIFTSTSAGSGVAHNNMPPYYVVNIWLRIS